MHMIIFVKIFFNSERLTDMKKLITIATLVLGITFSAMAQNNAYQSTLGFTTDA